MYASQDLYHLVIAPAPKIFHMKAYLQNTIYSKYILNIKKKLLRHIFFFMLRSLVHVQFTLKAHLN